MQPALTDRFSVYAAEYSQLLGLLLTSVIFGLCHSLTSTYFVWATMFGMLMGIEYNLIGLPAAVLTHAVYDWVAFVILLKSWKR